MYYPLTQQLKSDIEKVITFNKLEDCERVRIARQLVDCFGEYEHGTADIEDVHPGMTLEVYSAVLCDTLTTMLLLS